MRASSEEFLRVADKSFRAIEIQFPRGELPPVLRELRSRAPETPAPTGNFRQYQKSIFVI